MAAIAMFAHRNISVTDVACRWDKPKNIQDIPLTAEACFKKDIKVYQPLEVKDIKKESINELKKNLNLCGPTGLGWLLSAEPTEPSEISVGIENLIFSQEFVKAANQKEFFQNKLAISKDKIQEICKQTEGQIDNPHWLIVKKHRLTTSNFGRILKACQQSRYPPSLFQTLSGTQ